MEQERFKSFADFWPYYVSEHSKPATRMLHALGTTAAVACALALIARQNWYLLPLALLPGYGAAWAGHFFVEKNRPATFTYPLWSFLADYKMVGMMLTGKMEAEVERVCSGKRSESQ